MIDCWLVRGWLVSDWLLASEWLISEWLINWPVREWFSVLSVWYPWICLTWVLEWKHKHSLLHLFISNHPRSISFHERQNWCCLLVICTLVHISCFYFYLRITIVQVSAHMWRNKISKSAMPMRLTWLKDELKSHINLFDGDDDFFLFTSDCIY